jgi:hypothetical protein
LRKTVANVLKFLQAHRSGLAKLKRAPGVEDIMLDFAFNSWVQTKHVAMQGEYLPPELLRLAGELNIGIGLSIYPPFGEKPAKRRNASNVRNMLTNKEFRQWLQKRGKQEKAGRSRTARLA